MDRLGIQKIISIVLFFLLFVEELSHSLLLFLFLIATSDSFFYSTHKAAKLCLSPLSPPRHNENKLSLKLTSVLINSCSLV
jgi:hypothetical protein